MHNFPLQKLIVTIVIRHKTNNLQNSIHLARSLCRVSPTSNSAGPKLIVTIVIPAHQAPHPAQSGPAGNQRPVPYIRTWIPAYNGFFNRLMMRIEKYTLGVGDRFAHQAQAQLRACMLAADARHRDRSRSGTSRTASTRSSAPNRPASRPPPTPRCATSAGRSPITSMPTTSTSKPWTASSRQRFLHDRRGRFHRQARRAGRRRRVRRPPSGTRRAASRSPASPRPSPPRASPWRRSPASICSPCRRPAAFTATSQAAKGEGNFITEVSMDETDSPQTPPELLVILAAIADEKIPIQTIAPKFTGRFNKGVDYVGDARAVREGIQRRPRRHRLRHARNTACPDTLKLSVHSGSDKFSIYGAIREAAAQDRRRRARQDRRHHLAGRADRPGRSRRRRPGAGQGNLRRGLRARGRALRALRRGDRYRLRASCPRRPTVNGWTLGAVHRRAAPRSRSARPSIPASASCCTSATRSRPRWAPLSARCSNECEEPISRNVTENLFERHIKPLFLESSHVISSTKISCSPTQTAKRLYHTFAENEPILDYHCHLPPQGPGREPAVSRICSRSGWRATITSGAPCGPTASPSAIAPATPRPYEKFQAWAAHRAAHAAQSALPLDASGAEALLRHRRTAR